MKYLIIVSFILLALYGLGQTDAKSEITWDALQKITWKDFKKVKGKNQNKFAATCFSHVNYNIQKTGNKCRLNIESIFYKNASWVNIGDITQVLLTHEQKHFDLTEVTTRIFRKEVSEKLKNGECCFSLKKMKSKYINLSNKLQKKYDKETNHSLNVEKQTKWGKEIIPKMLDDLKEYDSVFIEINDCGCIY